MRATSVPTRRSFQFGSECTVLLVLLLTHAVATAQYRYQFDHWTTDDGLPQNAVNAILQTRDGYLWLATYDGLVRFDGLNFTVFNKGNTKGIESSRFDNLFEDRSGVLWAGSDEGWLVKYQASVFTTYKPDDGLPLWTQSPIVKMEEDDLGNFQIVSREGIVRWRDGRFTTYPLKDVLGLPLNAAWVRGNRLAWLAEKNLYWYAHGHLNSYAIKSNVQNPENYSVFEDQNKRVWIKTGSAGMVRVEHGNSTAYPVRIPSPHAVAHQDRKGNIWLIWDNGLGHLKNGSLIRYVPSKDFSVSGATASFYEDREGNLWIGASDGLYRARETPITIYSQSEGLSSDNVYSIYEDRAGRIWFGTWGGGLTKYDHRKYIHYGTKDGLASDLITSLFEDRDGYLWIGTTLQLNRYKEGQLSAHQDPDGFFAKGAWAIHQDRPGRFWFGTSEGLVKYERGTTTRYTTSDGLAGNDVKAILEDRAGHLWFGTWSGLTRFNGQQFDSYTEKEGLTSDHIRTLYEDNEGILWIGTYDGGLSRFKDGRFTNYTTNNGLFNNGVFQILEDERGYFWMSCNRGVYRVRRQELNDFADGKITAITSTAYGKTDGLLTLECNGGRQPAGWKTRDGRLWFPTAKGAAVIDPARVELNPHPPPVVIEEVRLNNEVVPPNEPITIPPEKNNNLEIRYQGLSFIRPEQQRFKYRLTGRDNDWVDAGNRRAAYYNRLPPGDYTLTVIAANSDGIWNTQGALVRLKVQPAMWQTWWFRLISGAVLFAIVALAIRNRALQYKRAQELRDTHSRQLIASQERDRKRIARDLHDGMGEWVNQMSHDALDGLEDPENYDLVTSRFARIASSAQKAIDEMHLVLYRLRPRELDRWGLTRALELLVERTNNNSTISFTCELDQIDQTFDYDSAIHIYRIVQEGLNNIERHSKATRGCIVIKRLPDAVRIEITDDGQGFDITTQVQMNGNETALGLSGIIERARLLGGKAEIFSEPRQGVRVVVMISLAEARS